MDTSSLLVLLVIGVIALLAPRAIVQTFGATGDLIAQLFVPPNRSLGWPHGVQETDEPWAWRGGVRRGAATGEQGGGPSDPSDPIDDGAGPVVVELFDPPSDRPTSGGLVVAVHRVRP
jgi:hypothetical protein